MLGSGENNMDQKSNIIPSIAWNMKYSFEYELGILSLNKKMSQHEKKIIEEYLRKRVKELKDQSK